MYTTHHFLHKLSVALCTPTLPYSEHSLTNVESLIFGVYNLQHISISETFCTRKSDFWIHFSKMYRLSIKSFPDYKHLQYHKKTTWNKNIFFLPLLKLVSKILCHVFVVMLKGKAVPLQAWSGPEGSRKLRFPDFVTTAQDGGRLSALSTVRLYPPGNAPGTHFCYRLSRPQGHSAIGSI